MMLPLLLVELATVITTIYTFNTQNQMFIVSFVSLLSQDKVTRGEGRGDLVLA